MIDKNTLRDVKLPEEKKDGIWRGVVEDNNDPLKAGRCKIRIFGMHTSKKNKSLTEGIPTSELPWAQPALGLIEGSISEYGLFGVPLNGSHVFVFFEAGNIMQPRYFASAPAIPTEAPDPAKGFNDPDGVYPNKVGQPDWNSGYGTYPHSVVLSVHGGHYMEFDSTPGNERIKIYHTKGTYVEIDKDGNIYLNGVNNQTDNITQDKTVTIGGDWSVTTTGTTTINSTGATTINSTGALSIESSDSITLTAPTITLDGPVSGTSTILDTSGNTNHHSH